VRLFQHNRYYPSLVPRLRQLRRDCRTFGEMTDAFLAFRECAAHILQPVYEKAEWAFYANGNDADAQRAWASEQGMGPRASLGEILKAQIEAHRSEIFYTLDATSLEPDFASKLPGSVKKSIAWHASPLRNVAFADYDLVICNFPSILATLRELGCRAEYFTPAHDPELAPSPAAERPIDVLFVGGYSRHHRRRAAVLEAVAALSQDHQLAFHLDRSRLCRLAESPLGRLLPLARHRRPPVIQAIARPSIFGRDYYKVLAASKIVLNGAIDMAGADRGNMRCFEALGSGALLLSDEGNYPEGMRDGETLATYRSPAHAVEHVRAFLDAPERRQAIAQAGHEMVSTRYSKSAQWQRFQALVDSI
jgi:hypothetical protein